MWTDGQTDMTKLIVGFRNFANAPKNVNILNTIEYIEDWFKPNFALLLT